MVCHPSVAQGWSRQTLARHLKNRLKERQGAALTNFAEHLLKGQSALAQQSLKDPYVFDFLGLGDEAAERDIENALVQHVTRFLLELGAGFAFVAKQYRLEIGGDEFFLDLLFYHTRLKCYVVIELKAGEFEPGHIGQLNFYLSAVDAQIKADDDQPSIGLLLCRSKNRLVAEYALRDTTKPMGIAEYQLNEAIPPHLRANLPTIAELEAELASPLGDFPATV